MMRSTINLNTYTRPTAPPQGEAVKATAARRPRGVAFSSARSVAQPSVTVINRPQVGPQPPPFPEAPLDGLVYGRQNARWSEAGAGGGGGGIEEAPGDSHAYLRANGIWTSGGELSGFLTVDRTLTVRGPADLAVQTLVQSGTTLTIDRALGENCRLDMASSITAVAVINWPSAGTTGKVRLVITNGGSLFVVTGWPAGTIWPGGIPPTITPGAGKTDIILLMSDDGGTTIYGSVVGQDYR